ncbi:MAG: hypothetical protein COY66_03790 [Candidatus Kerfeldbacteria bacterium CG_4_10_14_0_8_um_filter_42_10]|uniref:PsbP C-terminal domain-containing protein n=1 Tax=Candidatus Kerfeldbacteria bacterium CG_4_10_14_0_8_um_filter_42_10 TaxID=2014248 RepID=A0A2M7RIN5_9BACT|nr:MAG: hypothetical protein COY66_03790 [Candidatus Kerfeldbacteria bacterium CG_4_10_14_0_8_um_filter_42_10]
MNTPNENNKSVNKTWIVITILVLLTILIIFFVDQNKVFDKKETNNNVNNSPTVQEYTIYTDAEGKIIFTNEVGKYNVIFPKDWTLKEIQDIKFIRFYDPLAEQQTAETELSQGIAINIEFSNIDKNKSLEQLATEQITAGNLTETDRQNAVVNGLPAIEISITGLGNDVVTYLKNNDLLYTITGIIGTSSDFNKYLETYKNILTKFSILQ